MKKSYYLFFAGVLTAFSGFSQERTLAKFPPTQETHAVTSKPNVITEKVNKVNSKAFLDTLYYQDFADSLPAGWSIVNNNANNFQWRWDTIARNGVSTTGFNPILSTTASNGFMSLPSDFYNTPRPAGGSVSMDTYFESDTISITPKPSVWVSYQQWLLYCCLPSDTAANAGVRLMLQVSTDNFATVTNFDATDGLQPNTIAVGNATAVATNTINITSAVANTSDFKIRFYADGNTNYFWYIDDFTILEGPDNDLSLSQEFMEFNVDSHQFNPFYGQVPYDLFPALPVSASILNNGGQIQNSTKLEATITHVSDPSGNPTNNVVHFMESSDTNLAPTVTVSALTNVPRFVPQVLGNFRVDYIATSVNVDQSAQDNVATLTFSTSDTTLAKDDGGFGGSVGTGDYVRMGLPGGTAVGDIYGTKFIIESNTGNGAHLIPTSITFGISDDSVNIGAQIIPIIREFYEDSLFSSTVTSLDQAVGPVVASSFVPIQLTAADLDNFLTLPLDNGTALTSGLTSGMQYIVGFEVTGINNNSNCELRNDFTSSLLQPAFNSFINLAHDPGWGTINDNPVIRLNMGNLPLSTGINQASRSKAIFEVSPNPNNGLFNLNILAIEANSYTLNVRNMIGQQVHTELISINGELNKQLDLQNVEKGIYFVSLENENEKIVRKIIIK